SVLFKALLRPGRTRHMWDMAYAKRYIVTEQAGIGHQVGNYKEIVENGLIKSDQIAANILQEACTPEGSPLGASQRAFYQSARVTISAIQQMASNLAEEAERLAGGEEEGSTRQTELKTAAEACRHVPLHPARTFQEGLQACWLMHVCLCLEDIEQGVSFGRIDQALYPLYLRDIQSGLLNKERAIELIACFQLKCCETIPLYSDRIDKYFSGNAVAQGITLGGVDQEGNDATNELSGLFLDAYGLIGTREPSLHVRVHNETPGWLLDKSVAVLQSSGAKPTLMGDEAIIPALQQAGIRLEDARDYGVIGCVEMASQGRTHNSADAALVNLPICLELALNQGRTFSGKKLGVETAAISQMQAIDDVVQAYRQQVQASIESVAQVLGYIESSIRDHRATPVNSLLTEGCMTSGKDVSWGGATYNFTSIQAVGLVDVGDSLFALEQVIFDEKRFSLGHFVEVLKKNFDGHEHLRTELSNQLDRYGNGLSRVDHMTQVAADGFSDAVGTQHNSRGGSWIAGYYSMTCGDAFGRYTGALPNGRLAGTRLSNGISAVNGADKKGPTALLRSAASLDKKAWANCHVLNIKFDKRTTRGETGKQALVSLFRDYLVNKKGMQVQTNILDSDELRKAQENPADYPNLLVRVSGYCAYFNDLQPEIQDEIIERSAHGY
ncbi:MAG: formate acetyltransferase, partial [bacterium]|nr:formate acetyltransferase [bacterium]